MSFHPSSDPLTGIRNFIGGGIKTIHDSTFGEANNIHHHLDHIADQAVNGPGKYLHEVEVGAGKAIGGTEKAIMNTIGGASNNFQKNMLPLVLLGGGVILALFLLLRR